MFEPVKTNFNIFVIPKTLTFVLYQKTLTFVLFQNLQHYLKTYLKIAKK